MGQGLNTAHIAVAYFGIYGAGSVACAVVFAFIGPGFQTWITDTWAMVTDPALFAAMIALTIFSTVLAFHWMNVYQPKVPASRAALIYLLEGVFAALFSLSWGHDDLTWYLIIGGSLVLAGNVLVETPRFLRERRLKASQTAGDP
jgi:drug/metabolite transporter (DMT)-like permease